MTLTDRKLLENSLDQIGRGDATPAEATLAIRNALAAEPPLAERVYDAVRDVTWRTLTSRSFDTELQQWFEVFRHAAALAGKSSDGVAEKIRGYADLISQSARFAELQPLEEVLSRKHSKSLMSTLAAAGKSVQKSVLKNILGLADSNLSRVTGALQAKGLLERSSSGKEASFALTELGRRAARKLNININENATSERAWWLDVPHALAIWDAGGNSIGANPAFALLSGSDESQDLLPLSEWRLEMSKIARDEHMLSGDTWQLKIDEEKWIQFVERTRPDGCYCLLALDASAHMAAIRSVEDKLRVAAESEAKLRSELADAESRLLAYRSANSHIRDEILSVAARSNASVRNSINLWEHLSEEQNVPEELHQVEKNLGAMQLAMRHLMEPVDIVDRDRTKLDWLDPRQIITEAANTASLLGDPTIDATYSFGNVAKVRGALSPLRMALGHMFVIGMRHGAYAIHGAVKGSNLVATLRAKGPVEHRYADHFDTVTSLGLGYCQVIVETHGGALEVQGFGTESDALITLSFPVEKTHQGRSGKFKPERIKTGKFRKVSVRTVDD